MKRFLTATLAATLLFPSPILANDETMTEMASSADEEVEAMSDYEEYDTEMMLSDEEAINESATSSNTCTITFDGASTEIVLPFKDGVISSLELIKNIPDDYHFLSQPQDIKKEKLTLTNGTYAQTIKVAQNEDELVQWTSFKTNLPLFITYTDSGNSYTLEFESWEKATSKDEISKETLTSKLKATDSSAPYTINNPISKVDFKGIYYASGTGENERYIPVGYKAIGKGLTKVDTKNLLNRTVKVSLGTGSVCELRLGNFVTTNNTFDNDGNILVTKETLQKALNEASKKEAQNYVTFNVTEVPNNLKLNAYKTTDQDLSTCSITMSLSSQSLIELNFGINNKKNCGKKLIRVSEIDKDSSGNITLAEKTKYLDSYKHVSAAAGTTTNKKEWSLKSISLKDPSLVKGFIPQFNIDAVEETDPVSLYDQTFTINFIDSETNKSLPAESNVWRKFFMKDLGSVLTEKNMTSVVLPTGYGVALEQRPNSTAQTKDKVSSATQGSFNVSVLLPEAATVYVTKLDGYKEPGNGHIATKPEEPATPDTPQTPAEQPQQPQQPTTIPSQGHQVMYRLFNSKTGEHFYTRDSGERNKVLSEDGWTDEGHGWTAPAISSYPVYRVFNPNSGEHHFTKDKNEYETLTRLGWNAEGHAFFSADDVNNKVTLYRLYNPLAPAIAQHHYTASAAERDKLISEGWKDEGTGWFGMTTN